jgi:hypothetical protein
MVETKKIEGTVQDITKDSVKVNNFWIKSFEPKLIEGIKVGDDVAISYVDHMKNNRTYHNLKSILKYEKSESVNIQKLDTSTCNTLLMISKDIYLLRYLDNKITYSEVVKEVLEGLKLIQN